MNYLKKIISSLFTTETLKVWLSNYIKESLSNEIGSSIFPPRLIKYNFRTLFDFLRISVNNSKHGVNPTRFFASKVWQIVSMEMKNLKSLEDFKSKIRKCEPDGCDCKLYKVFTSNLEY